MIPKGTVRKLLPQLAVKGGGGRVYDGKLFKTLPISEKIITLDGDGKNTKIKLGFKKILLTEVIKN